MKKSTITANLIVSCICLAISLPLCCLGGCFGVIIFGFSLYCVINYTIKLATFDESKVVDNQDLDIWHKRFSVAWVAAGAVVLCIILVIIDFSPKSKSNKKTEESEIQTTERQLRESPDISVAQNLEIGQTVTIDDITVTVNAIKENPENYVINITYENNSGDDFKASLFDWEIGTDGSYDTYISDESNFRATFVKSGKKLKGSLLMPKNQNAEKIKFSSGFINYNYESDIYATWDIPEKSINTTETTTVTTSTKTTQTTITTTATTVATTTATEESVDGSDMIFLEYIFEKFNHKINYIEATNSYYIQIWFDGFGDELDTGISQASDLSETVSSVCQLACEGCRSVNPDCQVLLEVIDDRDENKLIMYSLNGGQTIITYDLLRD